MLTDSSIDEEQDRGGRCKVKKRPAAKSDPLSKKARLNKTDLYRPPTNDEMISLKETENLYQSSLFKLQMEELRSEMEVKEKKKKALLPILRSVEEMLRTSTPLIIPEASKPDEWLPPGVELPFKWKKTLIKGELKLTKPAGVKIIGSYLLGTCLNAELTVDMAVQIPLECLQPKDYLNFRYHDKRALYCAYLVQQLKNKDILSGISYGTLHGDHTTPVLILKLSGKNASVRLIPCLPQDAFKETRFGPTKSNVRVQWYSKACKEETFPPTPHYNSSILRDMSYERHLHYLYNVSHDFPAFRDAVLLLKVWLHQRELDKTVDGLSGFLASMLVAHLLDIGKLNKLMSGYQVFKNVLHFIVSTDWTSNGIGIHPGTQNQNAPTLKEFHQHFPVVFVDPSGFLNLCANMTTTSYEHLMHESRLGLGYLDDRKIDAFQCLFMTPVPFVRKFDHLFTINKLSQLKASIKKCSLQDDLMDRAGNYQVVVLGRLVEILKRALGQRILLLVANLNQITTWAVGDPAPKVGEQGPLTFGLLLNASLASSILDKGPIANTAEAKEFSQFWGSKSELRRFQDGSICEAVVWPGSSVSGKRLVCSHLVKHILELHAGIKPTTIHYTGGQLDLLLHQPLPQSSPGVGEDQSLRTGEEEHALISAAYTKLSQHLRGLRDLPLSIGSMQGTSPAFRHAEVYPPAPGCPSNRLKTTKPLIPVSLPSADKQCPAWVPSLKVVCHLESSGKWPDDLEAIHHIKAAFHLKMAELIRKQSHLVTMATGSHVFVMLDGFVFQVSVAHRREIVLLKEVVTKEGLSMLRDNKRSMTLERETEHLPYLTSLLNGVHQHHGAFGPTVRLAKRWVSSHLLADHVTEESIELMVAYLFLHPAPVTPPVCPQTGFLRFLSLVCHHDWQSTPLIINFNNDLKASNYDEIREHFTNNRSHLPIMFLATPNDRQSSLWTRDKPASQIFNRILALARQSLSVLRDQFPNQLFSDSDFKQIFRPPLDSYDVVIHLRGKLVPRRLQAVDAAQDEEGQRSITLMPFKDAKHIPVVNFDPVQCYLQDLREAFDELALFFHDMYGGDLITVLWKRPAFQPQPFKSLQAQAKAPTSSSLSSKTTHVTPNIEAILQDFQTLGRGLVTSIEVCTDNWNM